MRARRTLLLATLGVAFALLEAGPHPGPASAQDEVALTGRVTSEAEGAMEGVLVQRQEGRLFDQPGHLTGPGAITGLPKVEPLH
jgi:hypothetical protein